MTLSAGLRYTDEEKRHIGSNEFAAIFGFGDSVPIDFSANENPVTWRTAVDWQVTQDVLLYASYSTGFKSAAFNTQFIFTTDPFAASASEREEIDAFEIGMKSYWLDQRMLLNVAAFYYDYAGLQQILTVPSPTTIGGVIINTPVLSNVDQADILGAEFELSYVPSERWEFNATLGLLDTEVSDSDPDFDGNRVAAAPEVNYSLAGRYHISVGEHGTVTLQASYTWKDDVFFGVDNDPLEIWESYGVANARLIWRSVDERYRLEGFVDNLTDEDYVVHAFSLAGATGTIGTAGVWGTPRTYGIRATIIF